MIIMVEMGLPLLVEEERFTVKKQLLPLNTFLLAVLRMLNSQFIGIQPLLSFYLTIASTLCQVIQGVSSLKKL